MKKLFTILLFMLGMISAVLAKDTVYVVAPDEVAQLNKFYEQCGGKNWDYVFGWPIQNTTWKSIPRVTGVSFIEKSTREEPSQIVRELRCKKLQLTRGALKGILPNFNMPEIEELLFSNSNLEGSIPELIMPKLKKLNLSMNKFSGIIPKFSMPNLVELDLSHNNFTGSIPAFEMSKLEKFDISHNSLCGTEQGISLTALKYADLSNNKLTFENLYFSRNAAIKYYNYQDTSIVVTFNKSNSTCVINTICEGNIYEWYRDIDLILQTTVNYISIPRNNQPEWYACKVSNDNFPGLVLQTRAATISPSTKKIYTFNQNDLKQLNMIYRYCDGEKWIDKIGWPISDSSFVHKPQINGIDIKLNTIKDDSLEIVYELRCSGIDLSNNGLAGTLPDLNMPNLESMDLSGNSINGEIPKLIMPKLLYLDLSENSFSGSIPMFDLPELEKLYLYNNPLTGHIPNLRLANLKQLKIFNTSVTGEVPEFDLPNLELLNLSNNRLSGSLPQMILPRVKELLLDNNELSGNVSSLDYPLLETISLSGNRMQGELPRIISNTIKSIDFSDNAFTGTIPKYDLTNLLTLNLSYNNLTGNIPIIDAPNLKVLWLACNQLSGASPVVVLPKLGLLNLTSNKLTFDALECYLLDQYYLQKFYTSQDTVLPLSYDANLNKLKVETIGKNNVYTWFRHGKQFDKTTINSLVIPPGGNPEYFSCEVSNSSLPSLKLYTRPGKQRIVKYRVNADEANQLNRLYYNCNGAKWNNKQGWPISATVKNERPQIFGVSFIDSLAVDSDSLAVLELKADSINLAENNLEGILPYLTLDNLIYFNVSSNNLNGAIPYYSLPKLQYINLDSNKLAGGIPRFDAPSLRVIRMASNGLVGGFPNMEYDSLECLVLSNNKISGALPILELQRLKVLMLDNNYLTGSVTLLNMSLLNYVNIGHNRLNKFTTSLDLPAIHYFNIEGNQFTFSALDSCKLLKKIGEFFKYSNQDTLLPLEYNAYLNQLKVITEGKNNFYIWMKNSKVYDTTTVNYINLPKGENSQIYSCGIHNTSYPDLVLYTSTVIDAPTDIRKSLHETEQFELYPNPCTSYVNIKYAFDNVEKVSLTIFNSAGAQVLKFEDIPANGIQRIDAVGLSNGVYHAVFDIGDRRLGLKFVIEK